MILGIFKEKDPERRVGVLAEHVDTLTKLGFDQILVESGAGDNSFCSDADYREAGAQVSSAEEIKSKADVMVSIHPPDLSGARKEAILFTQMNPLSNTKEIDPFLESGRTVFSMDMVPRTTKAQSMDVLSSMATSAGYKAVIQAAQHLNKFFPMFMTAAGTIPPAKVLILGAGVAGLQAISTARRLGAVVEAFDVRLAAKEEVESLGAKFVEVEGATDDSSAGGYAVEQTEEYRQRQNELIQEHAKKADVVICTAQIPGRKAPVLVQEDTVKNMKPGSVIVDLAASTGGNCALTENDKASYHHGVCIIGDSNLASSIPGDSSKMYGKNLINFFKELIQEGNINLDMENEIIQHTCITHGGEVISPRLKNKLSQVSS